MASTTDVTHLLDHGKYDHGKFRVNSHGEPHAPLHAALSEAHQNHYTCEEFVTKLWQCMSGFIIITLCVSHNYSLGFQ